MSTNDGTRPGGDVSAAGVLGDFVVNVRCGDAATIGSIRRSLDSWLSASHVPTERAADIVLACYEAMSNVVEHAYASGQDRELFVQACRLDCCVAVTVVDHGMWRPPATDSTRGRGLRLMTALCDRADIRIEADGTHVELEWELV